MDAIGDAARIALARDVYPSWSGILQRQWPAGRDAILEVVGDVVDAGAVWFTNADATETDGYYCFQDPTEGHAITVSTGLSLMNLTIERSEPTQFVVAALQALLGWSQTYAVPPDDCQAAVHIMVGWVLVGWAGNQPAVPHIVIPTGGKTTVPPSSPTFVCQSCMMRVEVEIALCEYCRKYNSEQSNGRRDCNRENDPAPEILRAWAELWQPDQAAPSTYAIAKTSGCTERSVKKWRNRVAVAMNVFATIPLAVQTMIVEIIRSRKTNEHPNAKQLSTYRDRIEQLRE